MGLALPHSAAMETHFDEHMKQLDRWNRTTAKQGGDEIVQSIKGHSRDPSERYSSRADETSQTMPLNRHQEARTGAVRIIFFTTYKPASDAGSTAIRLTATFAAIAEVSWSNWKAWARA